MNAGRRRLTVVIGASRGIGRHLAERAALRGDRVLACARDAVALDELRSEFSDRDLRVLVGDFLSDCAPLAPVNEAIAGHDGPVSILLTAATIGPVGPIVAVDIAQWAAALERNVVGTARILAALQASLSGTDLVVAFSGGGVGGPNPQPNVSGYTTSKAALMNMIEVIARENPGGPAIVAVAPGAQPTGFTDPVLVADPQLAGERLLADVRATRSGDFDTSDLDCLLDHLQNTDVAWLSGRSLSARRDTPASLERWTPDERRSPDLMRMRRVDGTGVVVHRW